MTHEEAAVLVHEAPPQLKMQFRSAGDGFVALKAAPCPLYIFGGCVVYKHRPYNCRRFACLRPDVKSEPFEANSGNLMARVRTSRVARRMAQRIQRKAQGWALAHGWTLQKDS